MVTIKITDIYDVKLCCLVEMYLLPEDSSAPIIRGDQDGMEPQYISAGLHGNML